MPNIPLPFYDEQTPKFSYLQLPDDHLLNNSDAAIFLSCKASTLKQSRCNGSLFGVPAPKHISLGRNIRYKMQDLREFIDQFTNDQ